MRNHTIEYIGSTLEVLESSNTTLRGLRGRILNETKNGFLVQTTLGEKRILKKGNTFKINQTLVSGDSIAKRPEERLKL